MRRHSTTFMLTKRVSRAISFNRNEMGTKWAKLANAMNPPLPDWSKLASEVKSAEGYMRDGITLPEEMVRARVHTKMQEHYGQAGPDLADPEILSELPAKRKKFADDVQHDALKPMRDAYRNMMLAIAAFQHEIKDLDASTPPPTPKDD